MTVHIVQTAPTPVSTVADLVETGGQFVVRVSGEPITGCLDESTARARFDRLVNEGN
jgi:hypothetical protein